MEMRPVRSSIQSARSLPHCLVRALVLAIIGFLVSDYVRLFAGGLLHVHVVLDTNGPILAGLKGVVPEAVRGWTTRVHTVYVGDPAGARSPDLLPLRAPPERTAHVRAGVINEAQ